MAGEREGRFYESLVVSLLQSLKRPRTHEIFWDVDVTGLSKRPDVIIGPDVQRPLVLLLVTHSGSDKESNRKYWRSVCEYVEAKAFLRPSPHVINIVFDAAIKPDIKTL